MLITMTQTGEGDPTEYILGTKTASGENRTEKPKVIRGNVDSFLSLHRANTRNRKDTRLAASYHPNDDPTDWEMLCDIDLIERVLFPGFLVSDYASVWIRHGQWHKTTVRKEAHGVLFREDLVTGTSYNPYVHRIDCNRVDKAKELLNSIRGYEEPASSEHCRVFGHTSPGSKVHEMETVVEDVCNSTMIKDWESLAAHLDNRGYRVKRRKKGKGKVYGRKSITVTTPNGDEVKLVGSPFCPVKPRLVAQSEKERLPRINELISEINNHCLVRAAHNWRRYRARQGLLTEEQAAEQNFGFEPITLQQLIPAYHYEKPSRRARSPIVGSSRKPQDRNKGYARSIGSRDPSAGESGKESYRIGSLAPIERKACDRETNSEFQQSLGRLDKIITNHHRSIGRRAIERLKAKQKKGPQPG
jgi:hypothetical protein